MPFSDSGKSRFVAMIAGFCLVVAILGGTIAEERKAREDALVRHKAMMSLQNEIRENQAIAQRTDQKNDEWRAEMRQMLTRLQVILDRIEPILGVKRK